MIKRHPLTSLTANISKLLKHYEENNAAAAMLNWG